MVTDNAEPTTYRLPTTKYHHTSVCRKVTETKTKGTETWDDQRFSELPTETWPFLSVTPNWSTNTTISVTCALTMLRRRSTDSFGHHQRRGHWEITKLASSHQRPQDRFQRYSREIEGSLVPHFAICANSHKITRAIEMWTFRLTAHTIQMWPSRPRVSNSYWYPLAVDWQPGQRSQAWGPPRLLSNGSRGLSAQK